MDYKALVLEGAPEEVEARKAHYESKKFLCDLTAVAEEDPEERIFTTGNVIDAGRITGTTTENYDAIAAAAAAAAAAISTGKEASRLNFISYTNYTG